MSLPEADPNVSYLQGLRLGETLSIAIALSATFCHGIRRSVMMFRLDRLSIISTVRRQTPRLRLVLIRGL